MAAMVSFVVAHSFAYLDWSDMCHKATPETSTTSQWICDCGKGSKTAAITRKHRVSIYSPIHRLSFVSSVFNSITLAAYFLASSIGNR